MHKHRTLDQVLSEKLQNPQFRQAWEASELQYQIIEQIISRRLQQKLSQKQLALKAGLKQPSIARVESGGVMPSLSTLDKIARALGGKLEIQFS